MRASRRVRIAAIALCGSLALPALSACGGNDDDTNSNVPYATTVSEWNNVFYQDGQYYCVYPTGARELCEQALDPNGNAIPSSNWIEAQDPGSYNPDSTSLNSIAWGVFLLNMDWFDDLFDHMFKGSKYKSRRTKLHNQLTQNKKTYGPDIRKVKTQHWAPPTSPAPKSPKNKGTKDCAAGLGIPNNDLELAAFEGGKSGSTSGGTRSSNKGKSKTDTTDTDTGSASGGDSAGASGGLDLNKKDPKDTNKQPRRQQQQRGNGC